MCHTPELLRLHYYNLLGPNQLTNNNTWLCHMTMCLLHDCALLCIVSPPSTVPGSWTMSPQSPLRPWLELPGPRRSWCGVWWKVSSAAGHPGLVRPWRAVAVALKGHCCSQAYSSSLKVKDSTVVWEEYLKPWMCWRLFSIRGTLTC